MLSDFYIFVYISLLSSKDAPRDLLQNEHLESFWGGLQLVIRLFFCFLVDRLLFGLLLEVGLDAGLGGRRHGSCFLAARRGDGVSQ